MDILTTLHEALDDPAHGWSMGSFGAIAEFHMDPGETIEVRRPGCVATKRGAIRLEGAERIVPVAYEALSPRPHRWTQSVALCLPEADAGMARRAALTCLGRDEKAVQSQYRGGLLFDMGLAQPQVDFCIRTADPALIEVLTAHEGRPVFAPGSPVMAAILAAHPHRVALTRIGRVEVYQKIGGPDTGGVSPAGPHTHVLPKLMASGRTHSANVPIPRGLVPCGGFHPASPVIGPLGEDVDFDAARFAAFQRMLGAWGPEGYREIKLRVWDALDAGLAPEDFAVPDSRLGRAALRNALRQRRRSHGTSRLLETWAACNEPPHEPGEPPDEETGLQGH